MVDDKYQKQTCEQFLRIVWNEISSNRLNDNIHESRHQGVQMFRILQLSFNVFHDSAQNKCFDT